MTILETVPELISIREPRFDFIERDDSEKLAVDVYVKDVVLDTFKIDFLEKSFRLKFQTRNQQYHEKHGSKNFNIFFVWNAELLGEIIPDLCNCKVTTTKISLTLVKATKDKWNALIAPFSPRTLTTQPRPEHSNWIQPVENPKRPNPQTVLNGNFKPIKARRVGFMGLENIGNTCYLNSVLQCLANTRELKNYFQQTTFRSEINTENPDGMKGALALNFSALLRKLWSGDEISVAPRVLKKLISDKVTLFAGNDQQDAQELLHYLLDILNGDLSRAKCKPPYIDNEEDGEKSDTLHAKEAWERFKTGNDSIIIDLFYGLFKSSLICSQCNKKVVKFEPFPYLSLPIPPVPTVFTVHLFFINPDRQPEKHYIELPNEGTGFQLKLALESRVGIPVERLEIADFYENRIRYLVRNEMYVKNANFLLAYELSDNGDVVHYLVSQRLFEREIPRFCANCRCGFVKTQVQCQPCKNSYCSETCRSTHPHICKPKRYKHVSIPFIIAMPREFSLQQLQSEVIKYVKHLVSITPLKTDLDLNSNEAVEDSLSNFFFIKCLHENGEPDGSWFRTGMVEPKTRFFAVDWRCNPESTVFCKVEEKLIDFKVIGTPSKGCMTLNDILHHFHEPESLKNEAAWYCPSCREHVQAVKQFSICYLPKILVIHLKRFSSTTYRQSKVDRFVDFPLTKLDLRPFVQVDSVSTVYDLYGVVNHLGRTVYGGHYTCYARLPSEKMTDCSEVGWRLFDDSTVESVEENEVVTQNGYLLFYTRRDSVHESLPSQLTNSNQSAVTNDLESEECGSGSESEDYNCLD